MQQQKAAALENDESSNDDLKWNDNEEKQVEQNVDGSEFEDCIDRGEKDAEKLCISLSVFVDEIACPNHKDSPCYNS